MLQKACQQKALNAGNKINIGIKLKIRVRKFWQLLAYHEISTWCLWQEIDASKSLVLLEEDYVKHYVCICKLHKVNCTAIMYFDFYSAVHVHVTKYVYIITLESWYSNKLTII